MADPSQLRMLRADVDVWNHWRQSNPSVRIDLNGGDLTRADLRLANLRDADLRNVTLILRLRYTVSFGLDSLDAGSGGLGLAGVGWEEAEQGRSSDSIRLRYAVSLGLDGLAAERGGLGLVACERTGSVCGK